MSALQMEEINRTREVPASIKILAPADGFVLARNVSPALKFDRGAELYRLADLRQVWIVADVYENEAKYLQPGKRVKVSLPQQRQSFHARVSKVRPQFDPATRTLKVRLEADNPGDILRPDMFVDIELPVTLPSAVIVPADAVIDSGLHKTVYVAKEDGVFEPRRVETGWRHGDQVEIVKGLMPGERIAVSGTVLLDSESRMKAAAAGVTGATSTDPICGMEVDHSKAKAAGRVTTFHGETYYFCSDDCKGKFDKEPTKYTGKAGKGATTNAGKRMQRIEWKASQPAGSTHASQGDEAATSHAGHRHPPQRRGKCSRVIDSQDLELGTSSASSLLLPAKCSLPLLAHEYPERAAGPPIARPLSVTFEPCNGHGERGRVAKELDLGQADQKGPDARRRAEARARRTTGTPQRVGEASQRCRWAFFSCLLVNRLTWSTSLVRSHLAYL